MFLLNYSSSVVIRVSTAVFLLVASVLTLSASLHSGLFIEQKTKKNEKRRHRKVVQPQWRRWRRRLQPSLPPLSRECPLTAVPVLRPTGRNLQSPPPGPVTCPPRYVRGLRRSLAQRLAKCVRVRVKGSSREVCVSYKGWIKVFCFFF